MERSDKCLRWVGVENRNSIKTLPTVLFFKSLVDGLENQNIKCSLLLL
jgi:hypothetical protein